MLHYQYSKIDESKLGATKEVHIVYNRHIFQF